MSIYITGDTHGTFDLRKVVYFFKGREEEYTWLGDNCYLSNSEYEMLEEILEKEN